MKRPGHGSGFTTTTPRATKMISLLGPRLRFEGTALTRDEFQAAAKLYGFVPEKPNQRPPEPTRPDVPDTYANSDVWRKYRDAHKAWQQWEDPRDFMQAGADRDLARCMSNDGFRLVAWLAQYVEPGEDPLRVLVQMAINCGWNVDPEDVDWADQEKQEENEV